MSSSQISANSQGYCVFPTDKKLGTIFMKTFLTLSIMVGISYFCEAQSVTSQQTSGSFATPYAITAQDANSRVWQRTVYETDSAGQIVARQHSYTEVASGLNHLVNGQWVESKEEIDILPNGTAVATNGQHQAYFPGDIYQGQVELVTSDGQHLRSRPMGLSYFDGTNSALIAELTNSVGVVVGNNQVVYPNAFTDFKVDLRYTYTKGGFEQDVVLRQQPPTPESLGLNPDTTRLQVLTEFFSPPQPTIKSTAMPIQAGLSLTDESLGFGTMEMILGRAFVLGANATDAGALVNKQWLLLNGRQFLVEEVPVDAILEGLAALPLTAMNSGSSKNSHTASRHLKLPPQRVAKSTSKAMLIAKADLPQKGFVLDYQTINSGLSSYTFRGDSTYFISGSVNASGTTTFEGGTVLKYTNNASLNFGGSSSINCLSSAYRPIIFTAIDDNSVGETISGSTGNPTNYYSNPALGFSTISGGSTFVISNFRIAWAKQAIGSVFCTENLFNGQMVNCLNGVSLQYETDHLRNMLFSNVKTNFNIITSGFDVQNTTFSGIANLAICTSAGGLTVTNCILANVTNLTNSAFGASLSGDHNGFYSSPAFGANKFVSSIFPFQSAGAGNYYLTNGCSFFNAGATNIDPTLLASLKQKTTHSPNAYTNLTIATNLTLGPQALRDTNSSPDLGYHYDPIDYLVDQFGVTNATLTMTNGVAIACYNESGIQLQKGSAILSTGTPLAPNWFIRYQSVQEQSIALGGTNVFNGQTVSSPGNASAMFQFSKFACPAFGGYHLFDAATTTYTNLTVRNSEFWGGQNYLTGTTNTTATLVNNLFYRSSIMAAATNVTSVLAFTNNLVFGTTVTILQPSNSVWFAFNNDFDSCTITNSTLTNGYNAYLNYSARLSPTNSHDVVQSNTLSYQTGPLGTFYQPTNSPLINAGNTNANLVGLYHFTTQTNEVKETNSIVDIGYHYVAVDTNGIPDDTDGDGLADYFEDANGDGVYDTGDPSNWQVFSTDGTGMSDGWEIGYFGHVGVDPNGDPDGDGLSNLQEYLLGTNPTIDDSTLSGSRLNYIYDAGGWLNSVSGARNGSVSPDSEGNIQTVSQ
jgi:archaellum component FlaF (FlaF/FlaG flagellin family)